jgi:hypothetical protein
LIADDNRRVGGCYHPAVRALGIASITSSRRLPDEPLHQILVRRAATDVAIEVTDVKVE